MWQFDFFTVMKMFIVIFLSILFFENASSLEIQFDRIEMVNASYLEGWYNISLFRVAKYNRTAYGINFQGEFFNEINSEHYLEVKIYYNRLNNNQYSLSPAHISKTPFCDVFEKFYRKHWMHQLKGKSNFPQLQPNENFCPLKKVN